MGGDSITKYGAGAGLGGTGTYHLTTKQGVLFFGNTSSPQNNEMIEAAEVIDVNLDTTNLSTLGSVKFRRYSEAGRDINSLDWARPLSAQMKSYPTLHENVAIIYLNGSSYYITAINIDNYINSNQSRGITDKTMPGTGAKAKSYQDTQSSGIPNSITDTPNKSLGTNFIDQQKSIPILVPNIGDVIMQGRFGNSIRFGYNPKTNAPNIKISMVTKRNNTYTSHKEDLDTDDGLWITSDESILFKRKSIPISQKNNPPNNYNGKQIIISSGRIILNAKDNQILMFSNKGINLACNSNFSVDTDSSFFVTAKNEIKIYSSSDVTLSSTKHIVIDGVKNYLGGRGGAQKMVKGETLIDLIGQLIDIVLTHKHIPTSFGTPTSPLTPPELTQLAELKSKFQQALSQINYSV